MEEIEVPTEHAQEEIHHQALHSTQRWVSWVALSSALLAVFAAITALLAGHYVNEAMIEQMQASNFWSHYQAKSIKSSILANKTELTEKDSEKLAEYKKEQQELTEQAKEKELGSQAHMKLHVVFARGVTMFQIAIAIAAISVLMKRRRFWYIALGFGATGAFFLAQGLLLH
jgi:hypothetical protein